MQTETTECIYCNHDVPSEGEYVPLLGDDDEWRRLAQYHDAQCHWILTRADRLDEEAQTPEARFLQNADALARLRADLAKGPTD